MNSFVKVCTCPLHNKRKKDNFHKTMQLLKKYYLLSNYSKIPQNQLINFRKI